jgi:hypothetical protein
VDASWAISALLTLGFFLAAVISTGALAAGWFVLAVGMAVVTVVRFRSAKRPPG